MKKLLVLLVLALVLAACKPEAATSPANTAPPAPAATAVPATDVPAPTDLPAPTDTPAPTEPPAPTDTPVPPTPTQENALPPEPQEIAFTATDNEPLSGLFYPADHFNAPVVVLVHWIGGNMSDWYEVAPWLQNRGLDNPFPNPEAGFPWWDPSWFPPVPEEVSYNVFIFSLRGCLPFKDGCTTIDEAGWLADVQGAMRQATKLEGVDPTRIAAIGSSIGADGAPDGCAWLNTQQPEACNGALSLSPGGYLGIPYPDVVKELSESQPAVPAWCLADEREVGICKSAGEFPTYQIFEIPGGDHGNMLLSPGLEPLPMQLILDFLALVVGDNIT